VLWLLLTVAGLVVETALIVVLGRGALARDEAASAVPSRSRDGAPPTDRYPLTADPRRVTDRS
jgi:hypothetical protein